MFKLTVVNGAARGQSYAVKDGETRIGRVAGNDIVLNSQKVSKQHCVLVVNNKDVSVKDAGSSNGTFVNGVLTKLKKLMPGDRVSVGEFVFELTAVEAPKPRPSNVLQMPQMGMGQMGGMPGSAPAMAVPKADAPPQTLQEKVKFYFEQYILNFVYNLNEKHEWNTMLAGMFAVMVVLGSTLAVYPVLARVQEKLGIEAEGRAFVLARQLTDRNAPFIFERMETKTDVTYIEREPGVSAAYLIDMDGRVMAPGRLLNQNILVAEQASFATRAARYFIKDESRERYREVYGDIVGVAVPLRIFSQSHGKNVSVALGLVFYDRTTVLFDSGTEGLAYIQAIILAAILGVIIYFSAYRLTLRPIETLNEDIDQVLKGNGTSVQKKYKMQEIAPLIDIVNAALQRASGAGSSADSSGGAEETINMLKFTASRMNGVGMMIFTGDRRISFINSFFEEVTGIRSDSAIGSDIATSARDSAFIAFVDDMLGRAPVGGSDPVSEDFEFSGTAYRMECLAYGSPGSVKAYALTATKTG